MLFNLTFFENLDELVVTNLRVILHDDDKETKFIIKLSHCGEWTTLSARICHTLSLVASMPRFI